MKSNFTLSLFPFVLRVKIFFLILSYFTLLSFADSFHAKETQIIFFFFNGPDSYQVPYSTGSRAAAGIGRYLFYSFFFDKVCC